MLFIDLKEHGNIMRLVNDCHEAPNLQLMYWPELDVSKRVLPRRAFLVAKHDIPANVELTWDYGRHYERHWLHARHGTGAGFAQRVSGVGSAPLDADSDDEDGGGSGGMSGRAELGTSPSSRAPSVASTAPAVARGAEISEAIEQLTAAEELLPWEAVDAAWGGSRYDWLRRVQSAMEAVELAEPLDEFEAALQPWALGEAWTRRASDWRRRLARLKPCAAKAQRTRSPQAQARQLAGQ